MKSFKWMLAFLIGGMISSSALVAEEGGAPQMDPEMQKQMELTKMRMAPGEAHKALEAFVGKWNYTGKFWMKPGDAAQEMVGTAENTLIYGGRFLKQTFEGPWMGEHFEGLGFTGYDNVREEYMTVWLDSMGTGMMTVTGQYDAATKTLNQSGKNSCPMSGEKDHFCRSEWTVTDADKNTYTSYALAPDGKEFKMMEINYTRVQ